MTSPKPFSTTPAGAQQPPTPYELHVDEQKLTDFKTLLRLSPIAKETYENLQDDSSLRGFGVSRKWMVDSKQYWEQKYEWRKEEEHINSFPNFKSTIKDDDGTTFDVHFAALFSSNPSAIPIAFFHGWPGSFLEFLPMMDILRNKFTPENLPYHIIVPSLPGYALSSPPPLNKDWNTADTSRIMHKLLLSLGFGSSGYLVQGGDVGSMVARIMGASYDECKGVHLNAMYVRDIEKKHGSPNDEISALEKKGLQRMNDFMTVGMAYNDEHRTRPSTIGLVLASSPIAQLAWIGEKFLSWSDPATTPSLDTILSDITLYWLTGCYPTSIYTYRDKSEMPYVDKPVGYSYFPYEIHPIPRAWTEKMAMMVSYEVHEQGGHFAALERPEALWADVEEFAKLAWK